MGQRGIYARYIKRILDFVLSFVTLIVLFPLLIILTIVGAIAMKGNPFFTQQRPGEKGKDGNEKIFTLIKFRTMDNKKDSNGVLLPDELRLNKYGLFLRSTSLDELPELINILKGDMAICGPRPLLVSYINRYSPEQRRRHSVRPGLTGYAQVYGRNSLTWEEKFKKDIYYVDNISILIDIRIICRTVVVVFKHKGIKSDTSVTMTEYMGDEDKVNV